eukprot:767237-Hanusia_phi.AAC.4
MTTHLPKGTPTPNEQAHETDTHFDLFFWGPGLDGTPGHSCPVARWPAAERPGRARATGGVRDTAVTVLTRRGPEDGSECPDLKARGPTFQGRLSSPQRPIRTSDGGSLPKFPATSLAPPGGGPSLSGPDREKSDSLTVRSGGRIISSVLTRPGTAMPPMILSAESDRRSDRVARPGWLREAPCQVGGDGGPDCLEVVSPGWLPVVEPQQALHFQFDFQVCVTPNSQGGGQVGFPGPRAFCRLFSHPRHFALLTLTSSQPLIPTLVPSS